MAETDADTEEMSTPEIEEQAEVAALADADRADTPDPGRTRVEEFGGGDA
ncbi:MAG: hypothetical protein ABEH78_07930 [Haloferacaceae archaeon]